VPSYPPKQMPLSLGNLEARFNVRLNTLDSAFNRSLGNRTSAKRSDRSFLQEGLVSTLWQSWCFAVRGIIMTSVRGATTKSGTPTTSPHAALLDTELAYIASKAAKGHPIGSIRPLIGFHLEPTWGDLNKVGLIANGYGLSNGPQLATTLASPSSLKDLQICRNACAHLNADRIADVREARIRYSSTSFMHPSEMMFWVDPATSDFLWRTWTDEMRLAFGLASH
jgi:hypothetical protein